LYFVPYRDRKLSVITRFSCAAQQRHSLQPVELVRRQQLQVQLVARVAAVSRGGAAALRMVSAAAGGDAFEPADAAPFSSACGAGAEAAAGSFGVGLAAVSEVTVLLQALMHSSLRMQRHSLSLELVRAAAGSAGVGLTCFRELTVLLHCAWSLLLKR
jgi:fructose-1,6-bisphosphatase/inositol monophosphatase family enzyme